ncbi:Protein phosphatase 1G [Trichinella spiralis]|uniref:Protein phosphatase 1G n=1 Tax=Trichinella spiralis TaxID=6334 RepID=A0ABR3KTW6_TRISP
MSSPEELSGDVHPEAGNDSSAEQSCEHGEPKISTPPSDIVHVAEDNSDGAVFVEEKSITEEKDGDDAVHIETESITPEIQEYELSESDEYEFDAEDEPEEEMVADRDEIADEVARLQSEQDLPIEELLKNYGGVLYPNHPLSKDSQKYSTTASASASDSMVNEYFTNPDAFCTSDEDDRDYVSDATWKSEIRTGPECQAEIPDMEVDEPVAREEILLSVQRGEVGQRYDEE